MSVVIPRLVDRGPPQPGCSGGLSHNIELMATARPLHSSSFGPESLPLLALIAIAALGSAVLLGLGLGAFVRRRSGSYLLIVAAISALLARSLVAGLSVTGLLSPASHHLLEHGFDVVLVALVIAAVYNARTTTNSEFNA